MMRKTDWELEKLSQKIEELKLLYEKSDRKVENCKSAIDGARYWIDYQKSEIAESKEMADDKFEKARDYQRYGDRDTADMYREEGDEINARIQDEKEVLQSYRDDYAIAKQDLKIAVSDRKKIENELKKLMGWHKERVNELRQRWKEKTCPICGSTIRYHIDWDNIPQICGSCKQIEKEKWKEKNCKKCGAVIRYRIDWEHIPNYCNGCKENFKKNKK